MKFVFRMVAVMLFGVRKCMEKITWQLPRKRIAECVVCRTTLIFPNRLRTAEPTNLRVAPLRAGTFDNRSGRL